MNLPKGTLVGQASKQESRLTSKDVIQLAERLSAALSFAGVLASHLEDTAQRVVQPLGIRLSDCTLTEQSARNFVDITTWKPGQSGDFLNESPALCYIWADGEWQYSFYIWATDMDPETDHAECQNDSIQEENDSEDGFPITVKYYCAREGNGQFVYDFSQKQWKSNIRNVRRC